ncbi:hypothetical protein [Actinomadura terrae]|uniref:hypothetical protein n=1 Tax=Actinomadura terrae TaxID=604353 RepID=UPI001FA718F4|nr:hypothetical protein [Actinomadura terrae]
MRLPRPSEPFDRVYSAPEPPAPARRPRRLVLLVAVASLAAAAVVVLLVLPLGGDDHPRRTPTAAVSPSAPSAPSGSSAPSESETPSESATPAPGQEPITALPAPCGMVSGGTAGSVVPGARRRESANTTLTTCTYSSASQAFRWLRVETRLYAPGNSTDPVKDAASSYRTQWNQAHDAPLTRTITLEREPGLGDEAYRWFKADKGQPTVVGQVTARVRNALVTVSYSEKAPGEGGLDGAERSCLSKAVRVAREALGALR